jgi:hypothetical protein
MGLSYTCDNPNCREPISESDAVEIRIRPVRTLDRSQPQPDPRIAPLIVAGEETLLHVHRDCLADVELALPEPVEPPAAEPIEPPPVDEDDDEDDDDAPHAGAPPRRTDV